MRLSPWRLSSRATPRPLRANQGARERRLARIDAAKQTGSWRATTYAIQGDLLTAAGRKQEAHVAYKNALAKPGLPKTWHEAIEKKLQ